MHVYLSACQDTSKSSLAQLLIVQLLFATETRRGVLEALSLM